MFGQEEQHVLRPVVGESLAHLGESSRAGLEGKVRSRERQRGEKSAWAVPGGPSAKEFGLFP